MAVKINEECVACGTCEPTCPNDAISPGDDYYTVDPSRCTECLGFYDEQQCAGVCPTDAVVPDPERKETRDDLLTKYHSLHRDRRPVNLDTWKPAR